MGGAFTRLVGQVKTFSNPYNLSAKGFPGSVDRVIIVTAEDAAVLEANSARILSSLGKDGAHIIKGVIELVQELRIIFGLL